MKFVCRGVVIYRNSLNHYVPNVEIVFQGNSCAVNAQLFHFTNTHSVAITNIYVGNSNMHRSEYITK